MSRSLEVITAEREAAKALSHQIASGQNVIEIETVLLDPSIVPDRMEGPDEQHAELVESIRTSGQLLPILVRPHPTSSGRFQIAYGHRRARALAELGLPARAIVRELTDEDLVVAQGKENSERKDLSYIEKAAYAVALEDRGFKRETIMASLSVDKTELSRLISVARTIPKTLIKAIGPAPKTGRRRWMELVELLAAKEAEQSAAEVTSADSFKSVDSDKRFNIVIGKIMPQKSQAISAVALSAADGKKIAQVARKDGKVTLSLDEKNAPRFGDFLIEKLADLYNEFRQQIERE
jgi:ParB family chromosome partitioning protein